MQMKTRFRQALILVLTSALVGIVYNIISDNGIPLVGRWPTSGSSAEAAVPPSADEGDPPFISLDDAAALYQTPGVVFIDARDPEDYDYGRIKGAINIPYEYLPEDGLDQYWDEMIRTLPLDTKVVIYCSGTECELSLYLGRDMAQLGYTDISIFYGGWSDWENSGLPIERGED